MGIEDHQLFAVFHGDPGIIVAAVQVKELLEARGDRKASAQRGCDIHFAQSEDAGIGFPVGLGQGVHQIGGMIVRRKYAVPVSLFAEGTADELLLVHMPAACGIRVHFLEEDKVRLKRECGLRTAVHAFEDTLLRTRPALLSAVHEKCEISGVGAESDIEGDRSIFLPGLRRLLTVSFHSQIDIVLDPVVGEKNIGDISADN